MPDTEASDDGVPEEYRAAVRAGDPAAMMEVGIHSRTRAEAIAWYERAPQAGHVPGLFAMALMDADNGNFERARAWLAKVPSEVPARERIVMPANLYARQGAPYPDGGWEISPAFLVVSPDGDRSCRALSRAARRFFRVNADGRELDDWEQVDIDTPNWVSDVYQSAAGAAVVLDTKSELTAEMGATLLTVLSQELSRANVTALVTNPPKDQSVFEHDWVDPDTPPAEPQPTPDPPRAWFLIRSVTRTTRDGRRYYDTDYRTDSGDWVRNKTRGLRRDDSLSEPDLRFCDQLRQEPHSDRHGAPTWVRTTIDGDLDPMPPPELRADD